jgi:2-desacetyl-2-hydroxyethyl bacteriochlorophyllide A dehydrogenase
MHAFDVLDTMLVGTRVAVLGSGPIGLLAVQVARQLGAELVALTGSRESRLKLGGDFGVEVVLECSGAAPAVDDALRLVRRGGAVVLVGFFEEPVTADLNRAVMNGITPHTVRGEGAGSLARAVSLASQGRLDTDRLVTHHFPLEELTEAFDTYAERRGDAIKVMLDIAEPDVSPSHF